MGAAYRTKKGTDKMPKKMEDYDIIQIAADIIKANETGETKQKRNKNLHDAISNVEENYSSEDFVYAMEFSKKVAELYSEFTEISREDVYISCVLKVIFG